MQVQMTQEQLKIAQQYYDGENKRLQSPEVKAAIIADIANIGKKHNCIIVSKLAYQQDGIHPITVPEPIPYAPKIVVPKQAQKTAGIITPDNPDGKPTPEAPGPTEAPKAQATQDSPTKTETK